jgi:hypothetical protein
MTALLVAAILSPLYISTGVLLAAYCLCRSRSRATARLLVDVTARAESAARQLAEATTRAAVQDLRNEALRKDNAFLAGENTRKDQMLKDFWAEQRELQDTVHALTACAAACDQNAADWAVWDRNFDQSLGDDGRAALDAQFGQIVAPFAHETGDES